MDILVCFKVVPDLDLLPGSGWIVDSRCRVETRYVQTMINPFDESALEMSLKLSERSERPLRLTALTVGDSKADLYLKTLYALRFDQAVRIENEDDLRFSPGAIAAVICAYVQKMHRHDLIIMGRQSAEGDSAKTPLLVAEMLNWPCITQVTNIEPADAGQLTVTGFVDGGLLKQTIRTPCVLTVGNAPNSYLRVPTLKDKVSYGKKPIELIQIEEFNLQPGSDCTLQGLEKIDQRREGRIIEGATAAEKAQVLYHAYLKAWLEKR